MEDIKEIQEIKRYLIENIEQNPPRSHIFHFGYDLGMGEPINQVSFKEAKIKKYVKDNLSILEVTSEPYITELTTKNIKEAAFHYTASSLEHLISDQFSEDPLVQNYMYRNFLDKTSFEESLNASEFYLPLESASRLSLAVISKFSKKLDPNHLLKIGSDYYMRASIAEKEEQNFNTYNRAISEQLFNKSLTYIGDNLGFKNSPCKASFLLTGDDREDIPLEERLNDSINVLSLNLDVKKNDSNIYRFSFPFFLLDKSVNLDSYVEDKIEKLKHTFKNIEFNHEDYFFL